MTYPYTESCWFMHWFLIVLACGGARVERFCGYEGPYTMFTEFEP